MERKEALGWVRKFNNGYVRTKEDYRTFGIALVSLGDLDWAKRIYTDHVGEELPINLLIQEAENAGSGGYVSLSHQIYREIKIDNCSDDQLERAKNNLERLKNQATERGFSDTIQEDHLLSEIGIVVADRKADKTNGGDVLCFSGKDWKGENLVGPYSISENFFSIQSGQASARTFSEELRNAYECGLIGSLRKAANPSHALTEDEANGLRVYREVHSRFFRGELIQQVKIVDVAPAGILLNLQKNTGVVIAHSIEFIGNGEQRHAIPVRIGGELVYYRNGLPCAVTDRVDEASTQVKKYMEQISGVKDKDVLDEFVWGELSTFRLDSFESPWRIEGHIIPVFRIYDTLWDMKPYTLVLGAKEFFENPAIRKTRKIAKNSQ